MRVNRLVALVPCAALLSASIAFAQDGQPATFERGYMTAVAGASFADQRTPVFGAEYGEHINRHVQAYANFTYFDNLITDQAQGELVQLGADLTVLTATRWEFTGYERGLAFSGGAKYLLGAGSNVRPYVGAGPGVLNLRRTIIASGVGDITNPVINVFGAPDAYIDPAKETTFRPMLEFLAGVGIGAGRTYVDVGYRFNKVFKTPEPFSLSQFKVGVGMRF